MPGVAGERNERSGVWSYSNATGEVTFNPANDFNGTATLAYELCDPANSCATATITFDVSPVNDPPDAALDEGGFITEDGPNGTVDILANDVDADGNPVPPTNAPGLFIVDLDQGTAGVQTSICEQHRGMEL